MTARFSYNQSDEVSFLRINCLTSMEKIHELVKTVGKVLNRLTSATKL
jgi:hypothetical protein